ncbi:STAS/SEC14 domain-containing protein [Rufibacter tibetensis]|uniref:STAS/SEC14 domain-containing protein n=1 Tax=Rufibacter tibetensis TaxID=512763 RepID=A0A0P0C7S4_9BACT|nr:STAS/SEC14 domain-containing protein [Rufibacter tibetensis]ALJ01142.1 hypothetical protein DC20_02370 [Rufibacter tibetensis]
MTQEYKNIFGKAFLNVTVDRVNRWVHTDWFGYLTEDNVRTGALAYTEAVRNSGFTCVLNDTSRVVGGWDHSLSWVVNEWSPQAAVAGVEHFALITTPESFAEVTANNFYSSITAFEVQIFDSLGKAQQWLQQYSLRKRILNR